MEQMILKEIERQKDIFRDKLTGKHITGKSAMSEVMEELDSVIFSLMKLWKEGKSAHEKFFSDIILNSVDAIIGLDKDSNIFLWNKGAEQIFGYGKDEIMGRDFGILIPPYLIEKGEREFMINEVKDKGFLANYESERLTKRNSIINVSITRFAIYSEDNSEMIGSVGILRDITTLKNLQKELQEKENLALIGEVVSSIAHNLSNPLNIISGNADYLMLSKKEGDDEHEELKTIIDETARITKSIRGLLNFSKPITLEKTDTDINKLLSDIIGKTKFTTPNKKVIFNKKFDNKLGFIYLDKNQIEDALANIVINAMQAFTAEGEITISTKLNEDNVKIEINDNGPGILPENLDKIFKPFYSSKGYGKGTGLGLPIARRIINEHKGSISAASHPGKGTSFVIMLPF